MGYKTRPADPLKKPRDSRYKGKGRPLTLEEQQEQKRRANQRRLEKMREHRKNLNKIRKSRKGPQEFLKKSERWIDKVENFGAGGVVKKVASSLINKYKPKIKNQKEDYGLYSKQDYSDVIKNYEKTQKKIQRNRKVAGTVGGATAATVVASNAKDKK